MDTCIPRRSLDDLMAFDTLFIFEGGKIMYNSKWCKIIKRGEYMKLNVRAFALAAGLVWGINWFALTWWMMAFDGISYEMTIIGRMYRGFTVSPVGSIAALLWGFFDGFLLGLLAAWTYNKLIPLLKSKEE